MRILGYELSPQCAELVEMLISQCNMKVDFDFIPMDVINPPHGRTKVINDVNVIQIKPHMPTEYVEDTILHELRHAIQKQNGFPALLKTKAFLFDEQTDIAGSLIASSVLDNDVLIWLRTNFSTEYVYEEEDATSIKNGLNTLKRLDFYNNPYARLVNTLNFYTSYCRASEEFRAGLFRTIEFSKEFTAELCEFIDNIDQDSCTKKNYCTHAIGWIIERYDLWERYYIDYNGVKISDSHEYHEFC